MVASNLADSRIRRAQSGSGEGNGDELEGGAVDDILGYIDDHIEETIERLQAFCRQPSVAAEGAGME